MSFWTSLRNTVEDVVAPVAGFALGGPAGAAAGSALLSAGRGGSIGQDVTAGALGYVGGNLAEAGGLTPGAVASGNFSGFDASMLGSRVAADPAAWALGAGAGTGAAGTLPSWASSLLPSSSPTAGGVAGAGGAGGVGWGSPTNLMMMGGSLYSMSQADQLKKAAMQAAAASDPFAASRAQYGTQLNALEANPNNVASMPGYQAGLDAIQRSMAAQGYQGSGNMMAAMGQYGGNFYQQQLANLMQLSGASATPGAGMSTALQGLGMSNQLAGNSLNNLVFGSALAGSGLNTAQLLGAKS